MEGKRSPCTKKRDHLKNVGGQPHMAQQKERWSSGNLIKELLQVDRESHQGGAAAQCLLDLELNTDRRVPGGPTRNGAFEAWWQPARPLSEDLSSDSGGKKPVDSRADCDWSAVPHGLRRGDFRHTAGCALAQMCRQLAKRQRDKEQPNKIGQYGIGHRPQLCNCAPALFLWRALASFDAGTPSKGQGFKDKDKIRNCGGIWNMLQELWPAKDILAGLFAISIPNRVPAVLELAVQFLRGGCGCCLAKKPLLECGPAWCGDLQKHGAWDIWILHNAWT